MSKKTVKKKFNNDKMWRTVSPKGSQNRGQIGEKVDLKLKLDQHGVQEVPKRAPRVDLGSILVPKLQIFE